MQAALSTDTNSSNWSPLTCNVPAKSAQVKRLKKTPLPGFSSSALRVSVDVVELNPIGDRTAGMLQMAVRAWLLERADHAVNHALLLWAVRRNKLLTQAITAPQGCVVAAGKDETVVTSQ